MNITAEKQRKLTDSERMDRRRTRDRNRRRVEIVKGQDIGPPPPVANPERRSAAEASFRVFCETYHREIFYLDWSKDLLRVLEKVERVVRNHDKIAIAMPRGSGKTQLCLSAAEWGMLTGLHRFVMLIFAVAKDSENAIDWFKLQWSENILLYEDFPEVCWPIRCLENDGRKAVGQRINGERTKIGWAKNEIVLPTIDGSGLSGGVIRAASLDGHIRGAWAPTPDGGVMRPTLAICDDPQTDESARSQGPRGQTETRLRIINQTVQGLAGPDQQTAILVPCTVIQKGDLSDQILDRQKYPDYHGERTKRLYVWPRNKLLWEEYRELRDRAMRADEEPVEATEFYQERMATCGRKLDEPGNCAACPRLEVCMDAEALVDWDARKDDKRNLSSLQAAMHSLYKYGAAGFAAEFQNDPLIDDGVGVRLTAEMAAKRFNGRPRMEIPVACTELTMGIDVQQSSLWYVVAAWEPNFTGYVIDYGVWPKQQRTVFTLGDIVDSANSLQAVYPNRGVEGTIQAGLEELVAASLKTDFKRAGDAGSMRIGRMFVDCGKWGGVVQAVKHKVGGSAMMLSKGVGITAGKKPMAGLKKKLGERHDPNGHWYTPSTKGTREFQHVAIDTNYWKSFVHRALLTAPGDPGAMTLFGDSPDRHRLLAAHLTAETYTTPTSEKGVPVDEWSLRPGRPDNHWFDALVYATCAASFQGIVVTAMARASSQQRKLPPQMSLAELAKLAKQARKPL
ncbi:MAG: terminase gpA endonuclease subunit [Candidatus Neomarinimicrobiota bacterium]